MYTTYPGRLGGIEILPPSGADPFLPQPSFRGKTWKPKQQKFTSSISEKSLLCAKIIYCRYFMRPFLFTLVGRYLPMKWNSISSHLTICTIVRSTRYHHNYRKYVYVHETRMRCEGAPSAFCRPSQLGFPRQSAETTRTSGESPKSRHGLLPLLARVEALPDI